jgi:hypothetical protein
MSDNENWGEAVYPDGTTKPLKAGAMMEVGGLRPVPGVTVHCGGCDTQQWAGEDGTGRWYLLEHDRDGKPCPGGGTPGSPQ